MNDQNLKVYYAAAKAVPTDSSSASLHSEYRIKEFTDMAPEASSKPKFFHANDLKVKKQQPKAGRIMASPRVARSMSTYCPISSRSSPTVQLRTQMSMINIRDDDEEISRTQPVMARPTLRTTKPNMSLNSGISDNPATCSSTCAAGLTATISGANSVAAPAVSGPKIPFIKPSNIKELRAERKIMDLEISNSSLLAINKYLEKKLRKQAKDLEQLSSVTASQGDPSDDVVDINLSSTSEDELNEEETVPSLSPDDLLASRKAAEIRRRTRTHIAFLESSQKVSHRLQHCLLMTKHLLQDAEKSLNYTVDPSDVKLGGGVADMDDDSRVDTTEMSMAEDTTMDDIDDNGDS